MCLDKSTSSLIKDLRKMVRTLHAAYTGSRVELKLALQESVTFEHRVVEQQALVDSLQSQLNKLASELHSASGNTGIGVTYLYCNPTEFSVCCML